MNDELKPTFRIQVFVDGDDSAQIQTENAREVLRETLEWMKINGYIEGYVLSTNPHR